MEKVKDKRVAILEATLKLITEKGFHGTPMSLIATEANVGAGTIYRYFKNKEDLINELYSAVKLKISQAMFKDFSNEMPVRKGFMLIFTNLMNYYKQHPEEMQFTEQYAHSPFIYNSTRIENTKLFEPMYLFLEGAQQQEILKDSLPIKVLFHIVYGAIKGLVKQHVTQNVVLNEEATLSAISACWDAIKH